MDDKTRINKQKELIEEMGLYSDKDGLPPIEGRLIGLFMVFDQEQFTFSEIVKELKISKSSASNALKSLEIRGIVEYVTLPGDRKRYFRLRIQSRTARIEEIEKKLQKFLDVGKRAIELKKDKSSRNAMYLLEIQEVLEMHLNYIDRLKEQFKDDKTI